MTPLTAYPELLRLAAVLLLDPPKTRRILAADDVAQYGVDPSGPAGRLLGDLVMAAPDGPDAAHDTLTRGALAHGLRQLADASQAEVDKLAVLATDWKRYLEIRTLLRGAPEADKPALVTEALGLGRLHNFDPGLIGGIVSDLMLDFTNMVRELCKAESPELRAEAIATYDRIDALLDADDPRRRSLRTLRELVDGDPMLLARRELVAALEDKADRLAPNISIADLMRAGARVLRETKGLLADTQRRLGETVDRQGHELGQLRGEVETLRATNERLEGQARFVQLTTKDLVELLAGAAHTAAVEWIRSEPSGVRLMTGDGEAHGVRGLAAAYEQKLGGAITAAVGAALLSVKDRAIAVLGAQGLKALIGHQLSQAANAYDKPITAPQDIYAIVELGFGNGFAAELLRLAREGLPASGQPRTERDEDGYALCTSCRRERAAGRSAVQGCSDCLWLNEGEQERVTAEVIPLAAPAGEGLADLGMEAMTAAALQGFQLPAEMFGERGPVEQGRTVFNNAEEYVAHFGAPAPSPDEPHFLTLMGGARIPTPAEEAEFMRCATGGHTIEVSPDSDPEVCAALGLQHPDPVGAVVELIKRAAGDGPPVADVAAVHEADRIMKTLTAEQKAEVQRRLTARDPFEGWTFTPEHRAARERLGLSVPCEHTAQRDAGKRVPAGAGNRPIEVCSTCGAWRVMGPGEPWHPATEPFPEGSV